MHVGPVAVGMGSPNMPFAQVDEIALVAAVGRASTRKMMSENARRLR